MQWHRIHRAVIAGVLAAAAVTACSAKVVDAEVDDACGRLFDYFAAVKSSNNVDASTAAVEDFASPAEATGDEEFAPLAGNVRDRFADAVAATSAGGTSPSEQQRREIDAALQRLDEANRAADAFCAENSFPSTSAARWLN